MPGVVSGLRFWLQVFLAMPSACPVVPDGSKRSVPTGADDRGAVTMYTSDDNAQTFKQVSTLLAQVLMPVLSWTLCSPVPGGIWGWGSSLSVRIGENSPVLFCG